MEQCVSRIMVTMDDEGLVVPDSLSLIRIYVKPECAEQWMWTRIGVDRVPEEQKAWLLKFNLGMFEKDIAISVDWRLLQQPAN